jgi:hypothetical protein
MPRRPVLYLNARQIAALAKLSAVHGGGVDITRAAAGQLHLTFDSGHRAWLNTDGSGGPLSDDPAPS